MASSDGPVLAERVRRLLPALGLGLLACLAVITTPAPFALLAKAVAGRAVGWIPGREAWVSPGIARVLWRLSLAWRAAAPALEISRPPSS